jgi:voltage-gated potassium channel
MTTAERQDRADRVQRRLDPILLAAAFLVIPTLFLEEAKLGSPYDQIGNILNWSTWTLFAAEVVIMLSLVPSRKAWVRAHLLDVAIVVLTPPFMPPALQALRVFRVLRLLRLIKGVQLARHLFSLTGLKWAGFVSVVTVVAGGMAFSVVERHEQSVSTWDGLWWALTTVTTVGYGDYSPTTGLGRAIALGVMGVGIGFVALVTAAAAQRFIQSEQDESSQHTELLSRLDDISARLERLESKGLGVGSEDDSFTSGTAP